MRTVHIDKDVIYCKISTPEFKDNKIYFYKTQKGYFDTTTMLFTPDSFLGLFGYVVQFHSMEDFVKSCDTMYLKRN
jgi:hypothetical protein